MREVPATHSPNPDPLLTLDQAGEYLGTSGKFVRRQIAGGAITPTVLGTRNIRIRRSELERFIAASTRASQ